MFNSNSKSYSNAFDFQTLCTTVETKKNLSIDKCLFFYSFSIRGLVKVKALHEQVASMEKIVGQMKVNKEQVQKQVQQLRQRIDQLIQDISVCFRLTSSTR